MITNSIIIIWTKVDWSRDQNTSINRSVLWMLLILLPNSMHERHFYNHDNSDTQTHEFGLYSFTIYYNKSWKCRFYSFDWMYILFIILSLVTQFQPKSLAGIVSQAIHELCTMVRYSPQKIQKPQYWLIYGKKLFKKCLSREVRSGLSGLGQSMITLWDPRKMGPSLMKYCIIFILFWDFTQY